MPENVFSVLVIGAHLDDLGLQRGVTYAEGFTFEIVAPCLTTAQIYVDRWIL
jgi:hypothetical protein